MPRLNLQKAFRVTHLYFGVFITPAILFFALTGALQTFGLHETNRDHPNYKPAHWIAVLAQIHKKQTSVIPIRKPQARPSESSAAAPVSSPDDHSHHKHADDPAASPSPASAVVAPATPATQAPAPSHNPIPLRIFFLVVCIGLFTSTSTGLYMAYTYNRNRRLVTLTLLAGTVLPPLLLLF